ncbi:Asp-tRNA(Asn)/Glu-tRNA(Gln) amidotransferase subunit GatC [Candidatus Woesearchaeota archaeon]|jgi:aspartyl-tRNA(Asn)/glutamyl-tRNA(Gln) amidotransferase subunit C|nr:Asp-tRNA(Asn)/Glu-tRNA(Gln) amidotransferase subunit GatC [Candidatus Woesearchaeota archaeon]MBT4114489.1 Asp-tRNA(Asn)/Glu-tRNA(Gln) amidotransferase subunit GatC [Candidatus Woesearchaeota archaeon]MBT4248181.1 Asp-tRNA(Asn)/Glu-tRNA(Gln) amidotransferase subunit GatC [Candidatus Woesearchaeota archaeon]
MKVDRQLVKKVAAIARINLTESELAKFTDDFKDILQDFSVLSKIDTDKVVPTFCSADLQNVYRQDRVDKCLIRQKALVNTKHKENGFFKGPKTV